MSAKKSDRKPAPKGKGDNKGKGKKPTTGGEQKPVTPKEWNIVWRSVEELTPYQKNARINDQTVPYLINSIKRFGFKNPIVIDKKGVIIAGHTRLKAALELGYSKLPCVCADDLSPAEVRAFRLVDNKIAELSGWDFGILDEEMKGLEDDGFGNLADFGFGDGADIDPDDFFKDGDGGDGKGGDEPKKITVTCPDCGKKFEVEV